VIPAPPIDTRSAVDIARQLRTLLKAYAPDWKGGTGDLGDALVSIFARFAEIVIERLNRTPDKSLLAYLDLLGIALLPPQPARAPLTFSPAAGSVTDGVVPAGPQVAAPPGGGETSPLIFETERELAVTAAVLDKVFARDPGSDRFADLSGLAGATVAGAERAFAGSTPIEHSLYIGLDDLLCRSDLAELRLQLDIDHGPSRLEPREVSWSIVDGAGGMAKAPQSDGTAGLTCSGQIVFAGLGAVPRQSVHRLTSRWLHGRLATPIASGESGRAPRVRALTVSAVVGGKDRYVSRAFVGTAPLDTTKDFLPFGERPRLADALYLAAGDAFAVAGAKVTLRIEHTAGTTPYVGASPPLLWE
jgi:hypothetical protein